MFVILRPLRLLLQAMVMESTPRQMSLGFACGVLVGLVPKGNLLAIALGLCLAATRLNLAIAAFAALVAALVSTQCDGIFDRIGWFVLSQPSLLSTWTWLYHQPFVPWTDFNNSIVMGSFVTGLVLLYPIHRLTRPLFEKYSEKLAKHARRWWITRFILGAELADRVGSL